MNMVISLATALAVWLAPAGKDDARNGQCHFGKTREEINEDVDNMLNVNRKNVLPSLAKRLPQAAALTATLMAPTASITQWVRPRKQERHRQIGGPDQGDAAEVGMGIYGLYPNVKSPKSHSRHSRADGPVSETKGPRFEEMRRCGDLAGQSHGE